MAEENMPKRGSPILILTIDCNHKSIGGNSDYLVENSISVSNIADSFKKNIGSKRQEIFNLLKEEKIRWDRDRNELRINKGLKKGFDFCFQQGEVDAKYLPAIDDGKKIRSQTVVKVKFKLPFEE